MCACVADPPLSSVILKPCICGGDGSSPGQSKVFPAHRTPAGRAEIDRGEKLNLIFMHDLIYFRAFAPWTLLVSDLGTL
jgi:hypothetical protein